jgi:hypothetical protein
MYFLIELLLVSIRIGKFFFCKTNQTKKIENKIIFYFYDVAAGDYGDDGLISFLIYGGVLTWSFFHTCATDDFFFVYIINKNTISLKSV